LGLAETATFAQREGYIFPHAQGIKDGSILKDHGDALADLTHALFVKTGNLLSFNANGTFIRLEKTHQYAQGHGLAHAAAPKDAQGLAAIHKKANVLQNGPAIKRDADVTEGNEGFRERGSLCCAFQFSRAGLIQFLCDLRIG
jgi:hypothetical protein